MPKKILSFYLSPEEIETIDNYAKALGKTRNGFLTWLIKNGFNIDAKAKAKVNEIALLQKELKP